MKRLNIDKNWYEGRHNPTRFVATLVREKNGKYRVERAEAVNPVNQYETRLQKVNARDFTADLARSTITVL